MRPHIVSLRSLLLAVVFATSPATAIAAGPEMIAQAAKTGSLQGRVTDSRGNPLADANVRIVGPTNSSTTTAGDGKFAVTVNEGVYDVYVTKGGYQGSENLGYAVTGGSTTTLNVPLADATSTTLRTIGRVSVTRQNTLNTSASSSSTVGTISLETRENPNLNAIVPELPGVTLSRSFSSTPNSTLNVRGAAIEAKVLFDGHPISSGTGGVWNSNYANSLTFGSVEVVKGAGISGANAGESVFGTINLRSRDFAPKTSADILAGYDGYGGSIYSAYGTLHGFNNKFSLLVGKNFSGYRGPNDSFIANRNDSTRGGTTGLIDFQSDFTDRFSLESEIVKARWRFSQQTSLQLAFVGLQGQYLPQGGAYGSYIGQFTVPACLNPVAGLCAYNSTYNTPAASNLIGTVQPSFSWFPGSVVQNNEPIFEAEFRTAFKNDTILIRPYAALINRFIDGSHEGQTPGYGGWFLVTDPANCQPTFSAATGPTATGSAKGPCFQPRNLTVPYVGTTPQPSEFPVSTVPLNCSAATPCWTTATSLDNSGKIGFTTFASPSFSQNEIDNIRGITFTYLHPVGQNLYSFAYDYNSDNATFYTNDNTPLPAGCSYFLSRFTPQINPNCPLPFNAQSPFGTPGTLEKRSNFALTGLIQLTPKLQLSLGNYVSNWSLKYAIEDPAVFAQTNTKSPVSLISNTNSQTHYDPHIGLTFRPSLGSVIRLTGGSGITWPFAGQVSGLASLELPNVANNNTGNLSIRNPNLQPETTVAYDLGGDFRTGTGILSVDLFHNTIHNVFLSNKVPYTGPPIQGFPAASGFTQTTTFNGPVERNYGLELSLNSSPPLGWGYTATMTFQRAYVDQLSPSFYTNQTSFLINGKQLDGSPTIVPYTKGYAELRYAGTNNFLFTVGADYTGANNSTFGPAFTVFNSSFRLDIGKIGTLQGSLDNFFNYNSGTFIGQAYTGPGYPNGGGFRQISYGAPTPGATPIFQSSSTPLHTVYPRNFRINLIRHIGPR